jgi:uncharacterized protein YuzB (UPF0349 family)
MIFVGKRSNSAVSEGKGEMACCFGASAGSIDSAADTVDVVERNCLRRCGNCSQMMETEVQIEESEVFRLRDSEAECVVVEVVARNHHLELVDF